MHVSRFFFLSRSTMSLGMLSHASLYTCSSIVYLKESSIPVIAKITNGRNDIFAHKNSIFPIPYERETQTRVIIVRPKNFVQKQ